MGHFAAVCCSKSESEVNNRSGGGATNGDSVDSWFSGDSDQDGEWKVQLKSAVSQ